MIEVVRYQPEHADYINPKDKMVGLQLLAGLKSLTSHPQVISFTVLSDRKPIAIVGITMVWSKVGEVWAIFDESICKQPISLTRRMVRLLNHARDVLSFKRLQANVRATDQQSMRFIEFLGFKKEGLMAKYGPDLVDYYLYGRVT
jgi:hypothetical protein